MAILADPTFWVAVAFVIFLGLAAWKGWGAATAALDARAADIQRRLDEAQQLREEAQAAKAEYQRRQRDALDEAEAILEHAQSEAERLGAEAEDRLRQSLARREQLALEKIRAAEARALQEVRDRMVDLAISTTRRLIEENLDEATHSKLVAGAVDELPNRLQ